MKINSLVETTTSGAVASVSNPVGGMHKRAGPMFKGKKTNKPFYEEKKDCGCSKECKCHENVTESRVKQLEMDLKEMNDEQFFDKYKKTKKQVRNGLKGGSMVHDNGQVKVNESKILKGMLEADLREDDLILMPGQGARFRRELMPKKTDHEVEMARGQLYQSAKNAKHICDMLQDISEMQGIDAWVQSKITTAADYLETVRAYMESKYEMQHEVDEATAHEKFKKEVKNRGYDMDAGADRLERLLAKQAKERAEFEKKYAGAYGHSEKEVDEGAWDDLKSTAGKAWDTVVDKVSNIGYSDPAEYGKTLAAANAGVSPEQYSKMYAKQLADRPQWQKDQSNKIEREKSQVGYKPYPKDARPVSDVKEQELDEWGYSSPEEYGKAIAAGNKYVPPTEKPAKPAAPAGPSLWDRAKNVVSQMRPYDEKVAATNFGYKPQQIAKAPAQQTPMYEDDLEENKSGDSNLHDWFTKSKSSDGTGGWVQIGGKYSGKPCAKQPGQTTKPKCGSSKMKRNMSKKEEESAARRKRREDPNPNRSGKAHNVATEGRTQESIWEEQLAEACWKGYHKEGNKKMFGKTYPNCVKNTNEDQSMEEARGDTNFGSTVGHGSWVVYDGDKVKRFKTRDGAKAYAEKNGGKVASSEFYADSIQKKSVSEAHQCPECGGAAYDNEMIAEEKDACYSKVKSRYKVWPSAYASGALVRCRKVGASNWGNKSESVEENMSRAAKGNEKYGKDGMRALAKAGRAGAGEKKLDTLRNKYDKYDESIEENWSKKYKDSINCSNPKGFSQKAHCAGKKKKS